MSGPKVALFCDETEHKKVLEKGKPNDAMTALQSGDHPLPTQALSGLLTKGGKPVRLMFKLAEDLMVVSTKERTDKVPLSSIRAVVSEVLPSPNSAYYLLGFQLGPTTKSRLWVYWVPAQYVKAIKRAIR